MKTEIENHQYKKAYYIREWGDEVQHGRAFDIIYLEYGYETTRSFFIKDGAQFPEMVYTKCIAYDINKAHALLAEAKKSRKSYYEKQLAEAKQALEKLA